MESYKQEENEVLMLYLDAYVLLETIYMAMEQCVFCLLSLMYLKLVYDNIDTLLLVRIVKWRERDGRFDEEVGD